ncbi:iron transporter [Pseudomonas alkylphenolica]|uniref:High-affinity Fe2+ transport periplasmic protein n=1 Tax=Pseudomonas alkylphenolica TaxID=237609 RepID=A0A077FDM9_9PSED|nr:iron transporter [Pseudomonas alkylphenolica]AIL61381.1 high-affinity Fe2+ transport periplasmic protein [Pseudomonas alkylphenolica]
MRTPFSLSLALLLITPPALAKEYPIGKPQLCPGLEVGAVYLQPIEMAPAGMMRATADSDIHLEADIRATADNRQGFQEGSFVPYLNVAFSLQKQGSDTPISGDFHAMVANDGPHYGDNVKLQGPGKYQLTFTLLPPGGHGSLGRHTDKETGVEPWFERCELHYTFVYAGIGKKGGY